MSQLLVVLNDKELSKILQGKISSKYGVEVIVKPSSADAISILQILPDMELILCNDVIGKDPVAQKLGDWLIANKEDLSKEIDLVILGEKTTNYPKAIAIGENPTYQKIIDYIGFLLGKEERNILVEEEAMERERIEKERADRERELRLQAEAEERERFEKEIAEQHRKAREEAEKVRLEREKEEKKRAIEERIQRGKARQEKLEQEKLEKEKADKERLEKEKIEKEKIEAEKNEKERLAKEKVEKEKLEKEKAEKERLEKERLLKEIADKERLEKELLLKEKEMLLKEKERLEKEKEQLAKEKERLEKERIREQEARERIERGKERIAKVAREKAEKDRLEKERFEQEKAEKEREQLENEKRKEIEARAKIEKSKEQIAMIAKERAEAGKKQAKLAEAEHEENENEKTTVFKLPGLQKPQGAIAADIKATTVEYHSISIIYFMNLAETTLDFSAYARIKKSDGFEYIKKFQPDMKLSAKDLERVLVRCGKELYINSEEASKANAFLNNLFLERFKNPNLSFPERMKLNSDSFEILLEVFKNSSFDKYNIEIIKVLVKSIDILMNTESGINDFRLSIKNNKLTYGYTHLHLTCFIFLQIYDKFLWSKEHTKNKIIYLSLFHDLCLKSDRLIKIHHRYFAESSNLSEDEKNLIFSHADSAATILENIIKAPKELTNFVREHHGIKSGKGFSESLSITASPVCMAFVAIEDFVTRYLVCLEKNDNSDQKQLGAISLVEVFDELKIKYNKLTYVEVVQQIQSYFTHL